VTKQPQVGAPRGIPDRVVAGSNSGPHAATTTDERISVCQLVERSGDASLLSDMIGLAAERLIELEERGRKHATETLRRRRPSGAVAQVRSRE
jgi:hypothetical protein